MKKWITRSNEASLIGEYPGARNLKEHLEKGIIILDKPPGPSSHQVDKWIKDIVGVKKCSHGGTLDPRATGVLVIALEKSTKLMPILLSSKKEYVGLINLHKDVSKDKIRKACKKLIGKIKQLPPKKSAVARRVRTREIYSLEILEIDGRDILIRTECEAGTYIRRLAEQIGNELGVKAHLQELRRTKASGFSEDVSINLHELFRGIKKDPKEVVHVLELIGNISKCIIVKTNAAVNIRKGAPLYSGGIVKVEDGIEKDDYVLIFNVMGEMIGFGKAGTHSKEMLKSKEICIKTDRII